MLIFFLVGGICIGGSAGAPQFAIRPEAVEIYSINSYSTEEPLIIRANFGLGQQFPAFPTGYQPTFLQETRPKSNLIPAVLKYSTAWKTDLDQDLSSSPKTSQALDNSGYKIEKVPELASYSKSGPLSSSDIPSFAAIETIFNKATNPESEITTIESEIGSRYDLEPRIGDNEIPLDDEKALKDIIDDTTTPTTDAATTTNEAEETTLATTQSDVETTTFL